jgi:hypothetical protein
MTELGAWRLASELRSSSWRLISPRRLRLADMSWSGEITLAGNEGVGTPSDIN